MPPFVGATVSVLVCTGDGVVKTTVAVVTAPAATVTGHVVLPDVQEAAPSSHMPIDQPFAGVAVRVTVCPVPYAE
jgi:hypothetical protein